jgi:hypothetical protein
MLQVFNLDVAFNERSERPMQHETNVAAGFFLVINGWLTTFFQYFLMLQTMVFYVADVFLLCWECYYLMWCWTDGASNGKSSHRMSGC